ncbi:MAG TPA: 30S ribosomal protein S4 [candidate division Zixibacteria bacterium]|nr:30S ribosomal protein S4 [candidate division Zixibacteria bacterium]MDD4918452.1 30S ribosomal protein S4 [candidate division Zixibacteria bacterium]MDM7971779.1 30S ribosomal protein S4 [candidate division Zixibacteria bacterium]HOD66686.1 30S ribosomal protein S4 [candidate division Zixibacteria bacterium]HPC11074.1 30S ribosomal protein S4 [candidate division Zixibacteria bacterium]
MARYRDSKCKLCRREGEKLFLKGARCLTDKCAIERRPFPPGQHGQSRRRKISPYGLQLREKQKIRRLYGLLETQFHNYFEKAAQKKGVTGELLLQSLETRLDNLVYRLGFAPSRNAARQLVRHRHVLVDGGIVDIPAYSVRPGQVIRIKEKSRNLDLIHTSLKEVGRAGDLPWLRLNKASLEGELLEVPKRSDIPLTVNESLVVELYSK